MSDESGAVEIKDGKILVDGVDQGLEIAEHQSLRVAVTDLRKARTAQIVDGKRWDDTRIFGTGLLDGTIGVVGMDVKQRTVEVVIQSAPAGETQLDWHSFLGVSWSDPEFSDVDSWAIQTRLPADLWLNLASEFDAGRVQEISLAIDAPLWMKRTPFFHDRRPHMMFAPDRNGGHAMGKATSVTWGTGSAAISPVEPSVAPPVHDDTKIRQLLTWGIPAIIVLLVVIAVS